MSDYAHPEVLVTTEWVAAHAKDQGIRLVEVDVDTTAYDQGHVDGAISWNWQLPQNLQCQNLQYVCANEERRDRFPVSWHNSLWPSVQRAAVKCPGTSGLGYRRLAMVVPAVRIRWNFTAAVREARIEAKAFCT